MRIRKAVAFRGMNNLPEASAKFVDEFGMVTPQVILNADALDGGLIRKRGGYAKIINLPGAHSLWKGSVALCVANGVAHPVALHRVMSQSAVELCEVEGPRARLNYVELNNLVYMSNPYWTGIYDILTGSVRSWGVTPPPAPAFTLGAGETPPGTYLLCYTRLENGVLSGQGPIVEVKWEGMARKLVLTNFAPSYQCWITHPNGGDLFLAQVVNGEISAQAPLVQKLPTFGVIPAPKMGALTYAHGRIWGCQGTKLYYTDPNQYEWFRVRNFLPFLEELVMVAPVVSGLFVSSRNTSWFLDGTEPGKMRVFPIGAGAVPGSMVMALIEGGGYEISKKQSQLPSPVWMSLHGWVVGTNTGKLVHLTEHRLRIPTRSFGASVYRQVNGIPQIISSLYGTPLNGEDPTLKTIFERGKLYAPKPLAVVGRGGVIIN